jgi:hypothetical protein
MLADFKRALARVQSDYGFYIGCQTEPTLALAGYDLSADERTALSDPVKLGDMLKLGVGGTSRLPSITVKISGSHDWVNRAVAEDIGGAQGGLNTLVATEVEAVRRASTDTERTEAAVRLMDLIG